MPLSQRRPMTVRLSRPSLALALLFVAQHAQASDFSGIISMMFGIPALLLLNVALGLMLIAEPTRMVRFWAGFLGIPTLLAGLLLWRDAASLFRMDDSTPFGVFYFVLYALGVALLARHFLRRPALAGGSGN
jgi:hypothetical protein